MQCRFVFSEVSTSSQHCSKVNAAGTSVAACFPVTIRALYFLIKNLVNKLIYLSMGLAFILIFIGIKLIMVWAHEEWESVPKISTNLSLSVIGAILLISTVASLIKSKRDPSAIGHAGRMSDPKKGSNKKEK